MKNKFDKMIKNNKTLFKYAWIYLIGAIILLVATIVKYNIIFLIVTIYGSIMAFMYFYFYYKTKKFISNIKEILKESK